MKHTQGPWIVEPHEGCTAPLYVYAKAPAYVPAPICTIVADQREGVDPEANANLIAAAPDLLFAANLAAKVLMNCKNDSPEIEAYIALEKAIQRALGTKII